MRCAEFERRLQELLDEDPRHSLCSGFLPNQLAAHAHDCPGCQKLLASYRTMFLGLAELSQSRNPTKVLSRSPLSGRFGAFSGRTSYLNSFAWYAVTACAIMLMTFAATRQKEPISIGNVSPLDPSLSQSAVTALPAESLQLAAASTEQIPTLFKDPRRFDLDQASLGVVLNLAGFRPVTLSAEVLETQWNRQPAWLVEVADGLRPVTESVTGTLDALRRVLPGSGAEDPNQGALFNRYNQFDRIS